MATRSMSAGTDTHELGGRHTRETRLAIYIPPRQNAVSCRQHDAYSNTYTDGKSCIVPTSSHYPNLHKQSVNLTIVLSCYRKRVGRGTIAFTVGAISVLLHSTFDWPAPGSWRIKTTGIQDYTEGSKAPQAGVGRPAFDLPCNVAVVSHHRA